MTGDLERVKQRVTWLVKIEHTGDGQPAQLYSEDREQHDSKHPAWHRRDWREEREHAVQPGAVVTRQVERPRHTQQAEQEISRPYQYKRVRKSWQLNLVC